MGNNAAEADRWWWKVGGKVETVGVEPVADHDRTATPGRLLLVWAMTAGSATTPLLGAILYPYGFRRMIGVIAITTLLFTVPCGLFSEIGRHVPVTGLVIARRTYGWSTACLLSGLFAVVNMAYFGLNAATGAQILAALSHTDTRHWYWVVGGIDIGGLVGPTVTHKARGHVERPAAGVPANRSGRR